VLQLIIKLSLLVNLAFTILCVRWITIRKWSIACMARILLAEDDDSLRTFLAAALNKAGHFVADYPDGEQALDALMGTAFDLLLTDIVMPGVDGVELARKAAEVDPAMKIVFITGFAAVALNPANQAPSKAKVLSKPFHLRELVSEVEKVMAA
jgi:two-component system, cell cycle response regulator CpdR